jgi:enediyne biosynthesis protein E4
LLAACLLAVPVFAGFAKITDGDIVNGGGWCYGCAWADYNGDGLQDLFVTNNNSNQGKNNFLYLNDGDGTFTKVVDGPVVTDGGSSYGCTWGDFDNNGFPDLFVANYNESNFLYANNGDSTFTKVTQGRIVSDGGRSTGSAWADYDNDGWLDLYVCNRDEANFLYHNNGDGTFTRIPTGAIATDVANSSGCAWGDYDNDGRLDLVVANVQSPNCLYHNDGGGNFTKITSGPVVNDTSFCNGASWGDMDDDGDLDLMIATGVLGTYHDLLYRNNGDGTFTKITDSPVVNDATWSGGSAWGDFDSDGDLDLFVGGYDGHNRLYENDGTGTFVSIDTGIVVTDGNYTMGTGWADYDNDGDIDLFTARNNYYGGNNCLYRNDGAGNNWLEVRCVGTVSNRSAIGARLRAKAHIGSSYLWQTREVSSQTGGSNSGQSSLLASFGLGDASTVDTLVVRWPSGIVQTLVSVGVNQILTVTEQQSAVEENLKPQAPSRKLAATVLSGAPGVDRLVSGVIFDAMGRRVSCATPGVYFVREAQAQAGVRPQAVRKVVVTR